MAKKNRGTMVGAVGGVMIGAAVLLFVVTLVLNNLKDAGDPGGTGTARNESWAAQNATINQISTMLTVVVILLAVSGIVIVGSQIIALVGG